MKAMDEAIVKARARAAALTRGDLVAAEQARPATAQPKPGKNGNAENLIRLQFCDIDQTPAESVRAYRDEQTVEDYRDNYEVLEKGSVAWCLDCKAWELVDGTMRISAAALNKLAGDDFRNLGRFSHNQIADMAVVSNVRHGVPLTRDDWRKIYENWKKRQADPKKENYAACAKAYGQNPQAFWRKVSDKGRAIGERFEAAHPAVTVNGRKSRVSIEAYNDKRQDGWLNRHLAVAVTSLSRAEGRIQRAVQLTPASKWDWRHKPKLKEIKQSCQKILKMLAS